MEEEKRRRKERRRTEKERKETKNIRIKTKTKREIKKSQGIILSLIFYKPTSYHPKILSIHSFRKLII